MTDSNNSGDLIHVEAYTRDDGTHVEDYYRHRSGGGSLTENTSSGNIDVPNTVSNVLSSLGDNKSFEDECPALTKLFGSANVVDNPLPTPRDVIEGGVQIYKIVMEKVEEVAWIAIEIINEFAPLAIELYDKYNTYKGIYDKVSSFFPKEATQTQVVQLKTSIQGLRETQGLQQKNIDLLAQKAAIAKNQEEYSRLYDELAKQKNLYQKNETLLGKIEYSVEQQDYKSVMDGFESYMDNANQTIADSTSALKGFAEKSAFAEFDDSYFNQDLPYNFEDSHTSFKQDHSEDLSLPAQVQKLAGLNPPAETLATKYYRISLSNLSSINSVDNDNIQIKLGDIENTALKNFIETRHNVSDSANVVVPSIDAPLCTAIEQSPELKAVIKANYYGMKNNYSTDKSITLKFNQSSDLSLAIGKSELYNPQIDKNGNFSALIIDYYDFAKMNYNLDNGIKNAAVEFINNNAYEQQEKGALKNYVIIVPVNIDAQTIQGILNEK